MDQITLNAAIGALEVADVDARTPRHDDGALESMGRSHGGWGAEPQPFTQIGFPPPCNVGDEETAPNRP